MIYIGRFNDLMINREAKGPGLGLEGGKEGGERARIRVRGRERGRMPVMQVGIMLCYAVLCYVMCDASATAGCGRQDKLIRR
mgnify:CR=1 FL=1